MKRDFKGMELELGHVDERESFSFSEEFQVPIQEGRTAGCKAEVTGTIVKTGSRLLLEARVICRLSVECNRCLEQFDMPVDTSFNLVFHRGRADQMPEDVEEDDFILLSDTEENRFDIFPRVREAILLELPIKYLCSEDCMGLCARCGANLNVQGCSCGSEDTDPRWAPLRDLMNEEKDS